MRFRAALVCVAISGTLLPGVHAAPACASEAAHAALVVSTGTNVLRLCVTLDGPSVSGLRLLELAHDQRGLSYRSDGAAVCMLARVGSNDGDCFGDYPDYWGYWRGNGAGGWVWSGSGAASTTVHSGDVEGWAWGTGDGAATHPRPPNTTLVSVCGSAEPASSPAPTPEKTPARASSKPSPTAAATDAPSAPATTSQPTVTPNGKESKPSPRKRGSDKRRKAERDPAGVDRSSPTPAPLTARPAATESPGGSSFPLSGAAALVITAALGVGGAFFLRRRHVNT